MRFEITSMIQIEVGNNGPPYTKYIAPQDQTYYFNYLIARKLETQISQDKILLLFHSILPSRVKNNIRVAMGMTSNCSARYELTFHVSFYLLNN